MCWSVFQALQGDAGAQKEPASVAGKGQHPGRVEQEPGAGGQWDDWVGEFKRSCFEVLSRRKIQKEQMF